MNNFRSSRQLAAISMLVLLLTACGGGGGLPGGSSSLPTSISVSPATSSIKLTGGRTLQLYAIGHYTNGSTRDITASVTWASSTTDVAVGASTGVATVGTCAAAPCSTSVTATLTTTASTIVGTGTVIVRPDTFTIASATDPLVGNQWHLLNTGQTAYADNTGVAGNDINVQSLYNTAPGYTGYGVTVAVVDTGLEIAHEDLAGNVVRNGSWNFSRNNANPTNTSASGDHGTSVAGLIASPVFNGLGGMGVAPEASLKGFNFLNSNQSYANYFASLGGSTASPNSNDVWIFNQSYGTSSTTPIPPVTTVESFFATVGTALRGGLGGVYVKAAGNGFAEINSVTSMCTSAEALGVSCENSSVDPDNILPYNIVVGAFNASGVKSSYSTTGSALWASAPGGEFGFNSGIIGTSEPAASYEPAMVTTDQSGCSVGYATSTGSYSYFDRGTLSSTNTSCNYTNGMNGTSSATPVTAGVIALMLEAEPSLTWRDVKHLLVTTPTIKPAKAAVTVDLTSAVDTPTLGCTPSNTCYTAELGWVTNAAGYTYHNWYGFGVVNAAAAVTAAAAYTPGTWAAQVTSSWSTNSTQTIIQDSSCSPAYVGVTGAASTAIGTSGTPAFIEATQIEVTINHSYWGDLGIELTSPSGTTSILKNIRDGMTYNSTTGNRTMRLLSNAFYGETSVGTWTIRVIDGECTPSKNNGGGNLLGWQIRFFGH